MIEFWIPGAPVTQGSMASFVDRDGRVHTVHSKRASKTGQTRETVESWRLRAKHHARAAMRGRPIIDGPVQVTAKFMIPRVQRPRCDMPDTKPDLDKLCRALGDALEGVVVLQDSRIVRWSAAKVWTDEEPGVRVERARGRCFTWHSHNRGGGMSDMNSKKVAATILSAVAIMVNPTISWGIGLVVMLYGWGLQPKSLGGDRRRLRRDLGSRYLAGGHPRPAREGPPVRRLLATALVLVGLGCSGAATDAPDPPPEHCNTATVDHEVWRVLHRDGWDVYMSNMSYRGAAYASVSRLIPLAEALDCDCDRQPLAGWRSSRSRGSPTPTPRARHSARQQRRSATGCRSEAGGVMGVVANSVRWACRTTQGPRRWSWAGAMSLASGGCASCGSWSG